MDFIDSICLPVYDCFGRLCETLLPLKEGCEGNRREWLELAEKEKDFWDNKEYPGHPWSTKKHSD